MSENKSTRHKNKDKAGGDQNSTLSVESESPNRPSMFTSTWRELGKEERGGGECWTLRWVAIHCTLIISQLLKTRKRGTGPHRLEKAKTREESVVSRASLGARVGSSEVVGPVMW